MGLCGSVWVCVGLCGSVWVAVLTHAVGGAAPQQQTAGAQQVERSEQQDPPRLKMTENKQKK